MTLARSQEQPPSPILADFVASLPIALRCSDDFATEGSKFRKKSDALTRKYIQFNELNCVAYLAFDIDQGWKSFDAWHDKDLPEPNFIVQNSKNGHCHYFYKLATSVYLKTSEDSKVSDKAESYLWAIHAAMTEKLKADPGFSHSLCKNPLSNHWRTIELHCHAYELSELADYVTLKSKFQTFQTQQIKRQLAKNDGCYIDLGRNCTLFDDLRFEAYQAVTAFKNDASFEKFHSHIIERAFTLNSQFTTPLPVSEVKHTAKSVSKWTWNKYTGSGETCQRGAMGFGPTRRSNPDLDKLSDEEIKARQRASALRTSAIKRKTTETKITAGIAELIKNEQAVNHSSVAKQSQLNRNTVIEFAKAVGGCLFRWYQVIRGLGGDKRDNVETLNNQYRVFSILNRLKKRVVLFFPFFAEIETPFFAVFVPKFSEKMQT